VPFVEVWVATPLEGCDRRDARGVYARGRAGQLTGAAGIDDPYEEPLSPELVLRPSDGGAAAQAALVVARLDRPG
jgi:bifunctional enzyme CysN/CysC